MKYRIQQLKMRLDHDEKAITRAIETIMGTGKDNIASWDVTKKSFDAREKSSIRIIYAVDVDLKKPLPSAQGGQGNTGSKEWFPLGLEEKYEFPGNTSARTDAQRKTIIVGGGLPVFSVLCFSLKMGSSHSFWSGGRMSIRE
jgi:uncharacterized FAD-dependent dehydrogenase